MLSMIAQLMAVTGSLATPVALPSSCDALLYPQIIVARVDQDVKLNTTKTASQLNDISRGTISPYGVNIDQTTAGLRDNKPEITYDIRYQFQINKSTNTGCMSLKSIDMQMILKPVIYIAREYNNGECGIQVLAHEQKHVYVDQKVVDKYTIKMDKALKATVAKMGTQGPFSADQSEAVKLDMQAQIATVVESVKDEMVAEINQRQQAVDTLEEYKRVGQYCQNPLSKKRNWR